MEAGAHSLYAVFMALPLPFLPQINHPRHQSGTRNATLQGGGRDLLLRLFSAKVKIAHVFQKVAVVQLSRIICALSKGEIEAVMRSRTFPFAQM